MITDNGRRLLAKWEKKRVLFAKCSDGSFEILGTVYKLMYRRRVLEIIDVSEYKRRERSGTLYPKRVSASEVKLQIKKRVA